MHPFAQTNVQLFNQMRREGYSTEELTRVVAAYDYALGLFGAAFRGSGKPLLAHLVGTASVLASQRAPVAVVIAGMLHAAYELGDFGSGTRGVTAAKRAELRRAAGEEVEALIAAYNALVWDGQGVAAAGERLDTLDHSGRTVLLMRLANEVEDHLDLNMPYCRQIGWRRGFIRSTGEQQVELARRLGYPALAEQLAAAFEETLTADIPEVLCRTTGKTFAITPRSLRTRWSVRLARALAGIRRRMRRNLRSAPTPSVTPR